MMSRIDRYLGALMLRYAALSLLALLGLFAFANLLEQLGDVGRGDYHALDAFVFVGLSLPRIAYELLPLASLLGALSALSLLAADSELIALRAGGVSIARITGAALKTGLIIVIAAALVGEFVVPASERLAQRGRAEALAAGANARQQTRLAAELWMRDGATFISIGEVLPDMTLREVKLFAFDSAHNLQALRRAARAEFAGDHWRLIDVKETRFGDGDGDGGISRHPRSPLSGGGDGDGVVDGVVDGDGDGDGDGGVDGDGDTAPRVATANRPTAEWRTTVTPQILSVFQLKPAQLSLLQLREYIRHLAANRQQTAPFELAFWNKLLLPVAVAVMLALATPFVFVNLRGASLGRSVFAGVMLGLAFFALGRAAGYTVLAHGLPPLAGAALPLILFALPTLLLHRRAG